MSQNNNSHFTRSGSKKKTQRSDSVTPSEILGIEIEDTLTNSIKKRRKRSKAKKEKRLNPALEAGEDKIHCQYCQLYLTKEHSKEHKGTKKHKRNLRKWKEKHEGEEDEKTKESPFSFQALPIAETLSLRCTVFNRKKYESCFDTTNKDKDYICLLTAYLSLKLALDDDIEDFYISVFNKKWLSYGDIVIEIVKQGVIETKYAIKCKQVSNTGLKLRSFKEIINSDKEFERIKDLDKNDKFHNTKFAIFTTAHPPWNSPSKSGSTSEEEAIKSPTTTGILPIREKELIDVSKKEKAVFEVPSKEGRKFFLYTCQNIGQNKIDQQIKEKFEDCSDFLKVSKEFVRYVRYWSKGDAGGDYSLRKIDIILKLVQILLQETITDPIPTKSTGTKLESYYIWNSIIDKVDLTILKNDPYIVSRISDPVIKIIEHIFQTTIRANRLVTLDEEIVRCLEPEIKAYLFETVQDLKDPISLTKLYYALWKADRVPLLINDKEKCRDLILNIICFLKLKGFKRKFILLSDEPASVAPKSDLRTFKNLRDIREDINLNDIFIQISNGPDINLEQISHSNPFFLKWVTPDVLLNFTLQKCTFKGVAAKHYAEQGNDLQIIVNDDALLKEINQGICQTLNIQEEEDKYIKFGNLRGMDPALLSMSTLK